MDESRSRPRSAKPVFIWFDATANLQRLRSPATLETYIDRVADLGLTGIIVEVKPYSGLVLYHSDIAPRLLRWPVRNSSPEQVFHVDPQFDILREACRLCHARGLQVYASVQVFSEGRKKISFTDARSKGPAFSTHLEWAAWDYIIPPGETQPRLLSTLDHEAGYTAFVSPSNPEVQDYELSLIRELVSEYPIDGITVDRVRHDGIQSDFSPTARENFEAWLGREVTQWPEDIYLRTGPKSTDVVRGPEWDNWMLWRAMVIHDFIERARAEVKALKPKVVFSDYVGSWYPDYYEVGVNWASPRFDPPWEVFPDQWQHAGYADQMDVLMTGSYYIPITAEEISREDGRNEPWMCVEGSSRQSMEVVMGDCPVWGSIFVGMYGYESPTGEFLHGNVARAMRTCHAETDGLMIFDLCHFDEFACWDLLEDFMREVRAAN